MINSIVRFIKAKVFKISPLKNVFLAQNAFVNFDSQIGGSLSLGEWSIIRSPIVIKGGKEVVFGKYCAVGWGVKLQTSSHDMNFVNVNNAFQQFMKFQSVMKQVDHGITIGNSVWIADKAFILPGVKIGDGAVIGANAIVSKDVAPYSVVTGIPAREIKKRFSDNIIQELLQLKWWDWSLEKIARNKTFFEADLSQYSSLKELIND